MKYIKIFWRNNESEEVKLESEEWKEFGKRLSESMMVFLENLPKQEKVVVKRIEDALNKYKDGDAFWYLYIPGFNDYINKLCISNGLKANKFAAICWGLVVENFEKEDIEINIKRNRKIQSELNEFSNKIENDPSQLISIDEITDKVEPYTTQIAEDNNIDKQKKDKIDVSEFLVFMNDDNMLKGGRIMSETDYKRLVKYTNYLVNEQKLPKNIIALPKINLTKQEIIYTYSIIHDHFYPNGKLRKEFFIFLDKVFSQLYQSNIQIDKNDNYLKSYSYKKFRVKPPHYDEYYI